MVLLNEVGAIKLEARYNITQYSCCYPFYDYLVCHMHTIKHVPKPSPGHSSGMILDHPCSKFM